MKIIKIMLFILLIIFTISSCKKKEIEKENFDNAQDNVVNEFLTYLNDFKQLSNYKTTTVGDTKANKGIVNYNQHIDGIEEKHDDYYYVESISSSTLVKVNHYAKFYNDKVLYKDKEDEEYKEVSYEEYHNKYGVIPSDNFIGYVVNSDTIKNIKKEDNVYTIELDNLLSTSNMKIQMKTFGALKEEPVFNYLLLKVLIEDNHISKVDVICYYDIKVALLGNMSCTQNLEIKFS